MNVPIKKATGGFKTTTATTTHNATDFIAAGASQASTGTSFGLNPCAGIGRQQNRAVGAVLQSFSVHENTMEYAGNLPDSEVFSRPEFGSASFSHLHGFGRDGLVRKAGRMAYSMFSTSRPPVALEKAASGLQSQYGAETMTTVNTQPTPKTGNTSPLIRQQAIESALEDALHFIRIDHPGHSLCQATARTRRALSMLKQANAELSQAVRAQIGGAA